MKKGYWEDTYQLLVCLGPLPPIHNRFHVQLCSHHLRQFIILVQNWVVPRSAFQQRFAIPFTSMIPDYVLVATQMLRIKVKLVNLQRRPSRIRGTGTGTSTIIGVGFFMLKVEKWSQLCRIGGFLRRTQRIECEWIHVYWNPAQRFHRYPQLSVEQASQNPSVEISNWKELEIQTHELQWAPNPIPESNYFHKKSPRKWLMQKLSNLRKIETENFR